MGDVISLEVQSSEKVSLDICEEDAIILTYPSDQITVDLHSDGTEIIYATAEATVEHTCEPIYAQVLLKNITYDIF